MDGLQQDCGASARSPPRHRRSYTIMLILLYAFVSERIFRARESTPCIYIRSVGFNSFRERETLRASSSDLPSIYTRTSARFIRVYTYMYINNINMLSKQYANGRNPNISRLRFVGIRAVVPTIRTKSLRDFANRRDDYNGYRRRGIINAYY